MVEGVYANTADIAQSVKIIKGRSSENLTDKVTTSTNTTSGGKGICELYKQLFLPLLCLVNTADSTIGAIISKNKHSQIRHDSSCCAQGHCLSY